MAWFSPYASKQASAETSRHTNTQRDKAALAPLVDSLLKAWHTMASMMKYRGWVITEEDEAMTAEEIFRRCVTEERDATDNPCFTLRRERLSMLVGTTSVVAVADDADVEEEEEEEEGTAGGDGESKEAEHTPAGVTTRTVTTNSIVVAFPPSGSIGVRQIRGYAETMMMMRTRLCHTILVFEDSKITKQAQVAMEAAQKSDHLRFEVFLQCEVQVDISEHELIGRHRLVGVAETAELLAHYRLKADQLPRIQESDAMARFIGAQPGDVVKIVRASETAGRYATYRLCVRLG